jgi:hypothetical protein
MGSFRIPLGSAPIESIFDSIPSGMKAHLRAGFTVLSRLSTDSIAKLAAHLGSGIESLRQAEIEDLANVIGITISESQELTATLGFALAAVTSEIDAKMFTTAASRAGVLSEDSIPGFFRLLAALEPQKAAIRRSMRNQRITSEILPAYEDIELTVDLRLGFEKGVVDVAVPVVIGYLTTDDRDSRLWFQLGKSQLIELISKLEKIRTQLELAEKWSEDKEGEV